VQGESRSEQGQITYHSQHQHFRVSRGLTGVRVHAEPAVRDVDGVVSCAICGLAASCRPDDRNPKPVGPKADSGRMGGVQARDWDLGWYDGGGRFSNEGRVDEEK
jgi:hypothetical protein